MDIFSIFNFSSKQKNYFKKTLLIIFAVNLTVGFGVVGFIYPSPVLACPCWPPPEPTYIISGMKFNDENGNGVKDCFESGLKGWTITIEGPDQFSDSATTNCLGRYKFSGLSPGSYTLCEVRQEGWEQTYPTENNGCHIVEITDSMVTGINFGNHQIPEPEPYCGDGNLDPGEECDDGNNIDGDGCSANCQIEEGPPGPECTDADQDGYYAYDEVYCPEGDDCDDADSEVNPGAEEACNNGVDDDCDGDSDCDDEDCAEDESCIEGPEPYCGDGIINGEEECEEDEDCEEGMVCNNCICEGEPSETECTPEATTTCSTGQLGICAAGTQTCNQEGFWGECIQDNASTTEVCDDSLDNDCDGDIDCDDEDCSEDSACQAGPPSYPTYGVGDGGGGGAPEGLSIFNEENVEVLSDSAKVSWFTNIFATTRVIYDTLSHSSLGVPPNYGYASSTPETDSMTKVTFHTVTITGLTSGTIYYWRAISHSSPEVWGNELSFTTEGTPPEEEVGVEEEEEVLPPAGGEEGLPEEEEEEEEEGELPGEEISLEEIEKELEGIVGRIETIREEIAGMIPPQTLVEAPEIEAEGEEAEREEIVEEVEEEKIVEAEEEFKEEEGPKVGLERLLAAIGGIFNLENLWWLLILVIVVIIILFFLSRKKKKKKEGQGQINL